MPFEALVGRVDERPVEPPGTDSRLVARDQQNGLGSKAKASRRVPGVAEEPLQNELEQSP